MSTQDATTMYEREFHLKRRRGVSKKSEKRKKRQDGEKKQIRTPLSALGVIIFLNFDQIFSGFSQNAAILGKS